MPTIKVVKLDLFEQIGQSYTDEGFDELCFQFGIELDEVTSEAVMQRKEKGDREASVVESKAEEIIYKIDVPANRYDLLCVEGIARALKIFIGGMQPPRFVALPSPASGRLEMHVTAAVASVRPIIVCACLRDITFSRASYNSFIELQDKLHMNLCRQRTLVSIGTHDMDTVTAPFTYDAQAPQDIVFAPLNSSEVVNGAQLFANLEKDLKLSKFLHIVRDCARYPVIRDAQGRVLSLPPIINSDHSKISLATRNVFIEVTATDANKAHVVLSTIVSMFSQYCTQPFSYEQVDTVLPDGSRTTSPDMSTRLVSADVPYIQNLSGLKLAAHEMQAILGKMQLSCAVSADAAQLHVDVPVTRSDVLHACDVAEDVAIAHGYNNVPKRVPHTPSFGSQQPINRISDLLRHECAAAGFTEALNWGLCSHVDAFANMQRVDDGKTAVVLLAPKTADFEITRPTLLPGLLRTLESNKSQPLPIKMFEVSDVCVQSSDTDTGATNLRRLAALQTGTRNDDGTYGSGLELTIGLLDHIMLKIGALHRSVASSDAPPRGGVYHIEASESDAAFFPGRSGQIILNGRSIGVIGAIHPVVAGNFSVPFACSGLEMDIEGFSMKK